MTDYFFDMGARILTTERECDIIPYRASEVAERICGGKR